MRRLALSLVVIIGLTLTAVPLVAAECQAECMGCSRTIMIIPTGSSHTGEPIVATTPANLMILHTGIGPIKNVWLLVVMNEQTYNALDRITINDSAFMTKADFQLAAAKKIPPAFADVSTGYPGSLCEYETAAIKDKMDEEGNLLYFGVKAFLPEITKQPTYFALAVELESSADLKALIIALGRYDASCNLNGANTNCVPNKPFNRSSSFSKSTLVVPELATLFMTAAPIGALGLLAFKRRKR